MAVTSGRGKPRIAFVHTVGFLVDMFRRMAEKELPDTEIVHILNESLLKDLLRDGPSPMITRRIVEQALLAADTGVDIVVFTCSSTSPGIDVARQMSAVPILKIDDPMAQQAVAAGSRIGLLCTAKSTVEPSSALLHAHAQAAGKTVSIAVSLASEAYDALFGGNRDLHDEIMLKAATDLSPHCDVIVLAQASLAHLRDGIAAKITIPVFASPQLLMERLRGDVAALKTQ